MRSGKQQALAQRRAYAGGSAAAMSPKRKWPLRRVIEDVWVEVPPLLPAGSPFKVRRQKLECGHLIGIPTDMLGERYPERRRCGKCYSESLSAVPDPYKQDGYVGPPVVQ